MTAGTGRYPVVIVNRKDLMGVQASLLIHEHMEPTKEVVDRLAEVIRRPYQYAEAIFQYILYPYRVSHLLPPDVHLRYDRWEGFRDITLTNVVDEAVDIIRSEHGLKLDVHPSGPCGVEVSFTNRKDLGFIRGRRHILAIIEIAPDGALYAGLTCEQTLTTHMNASWELLQPTSEKRVEWVRKAIMTEIIDSLQMGLMQVSLVRLEKLLSERLSGVTVSVTAGGDPLYVSVDWWKGDKEGSVMADLSDPESQVDYLAECILDDLRR